MSGAFVEQAVLIGFESVARDRVIDFEGPAVNATGKRVRVGETLFSKKLCSLETAHPVMTVHYDSLFGVLKKFLEHRLDFAKRCVN